MSEGLPRIDETQRVSAPALPGADESVRARGRGLAAIHAAYLQEVGQIEQVLDAIDGGSTAPAALMAHLAGLGFAENLRLFGNLCGRQCQVLGMHHAIEERMMFPGIEARAGAPLVPLITQLRREHEVVHDLLGRLEEAARALVDRPDPRRMRDCRRVFEALAAAIRSHFKYEETELEGALGLYPEVL